MSNFVKHARIELELLYKAEPDCILEEFHGEIIALVERFAGSGQSGGSAPFTASALSEIIRKLLLFEPLTPLMDNASEWNDISEAEHTLYQNNRNSAVFKTGNKAHFIDAVVFVDELGVGLNCEVWASRDAAIHGDAYLKVSSCGFIKSFPFTPKTFYVDVITIGANTDDWDFYVKDPEQLKEVYDYYDYKPTE